MVKEIDHAGRFFILIKRRTHGKGKKGNTGKTV